MKSRLLIITVFVLTLIPVTAKSFGIWDVVVEYPAHHTSIENINGTLYYMSEPFELNSNYPNISFHDAWFTPPYTTTPPRYVYSDVTFFDETQETLRVIFTQPDFTDHEKPQAGLVAKSDGYHFLVSVNLEELPPLKQIESGLLLDEVQCKQDLIWIQKYDGSVACVSEKTKQKLIERKWIKTADNLDIFKTIPSYNYEIKTTTGATHGSQYQISGGAVDDILYDEQANSLTLLLGKSDEGYLQIVMPSGLLHIPSEAPFVYYVTVDDKPTKFEKLSPILLRIPFEKNAQQIEITAISSDENSLILVRNSDNLYCSSANEEIDGHCHPLENIVFGDSNKKKENGWKLYSGGAGWTLPENSTLTPVYKKVDFGIPPLDFTAMLDDKIFVDKCESNGGIWNYTRHDCEVSWTVCTGINGIIIQEDVTPLCIDTGIIDDDPLTVKVCHGAGIIRASCVFEYEN